MSTKIAWSHLTTPGAVRTRSKDLSQSHRQMMSDLIDVRIERGMTQENVAEVLGVTRQRISKLEQYDSNPRLETVRRYANAVGALVDTQVEKDNRHETVRAESDMVFYQSLKVSYRTDKRLHASSIISSGGLHKRIWSDSTHVMSQSTPADFALVA